MRCPKQIEDFTYYHKKPNTICKGFLYTTSIFVDIDNPDKKRLIRVYLPSDYEFDNPKKRFPVMYMMDGKNLFDDYTSYVGEWHCDETIERRIKNNKKSFIIVGIDSAKKDMDRMQEMTPKSTHLLYHKKDVELGYAETLANFIIFNLKPRIDSIFYTLTDKNNTAIGGSSMGGLFSFYLGMKFKENIGFSLCFSPAFMVYQNKFFKHKLSKYHFNNEEYGRFYFYVGGQEFEHRFVDLTFYTYRYLFRKGFNHNQIKLVFDSSLKHHESSWSKYYEDGVSYWLDDDYEY